MKAPLRPELAQVRLRTWCAQRVAELGLAPVLLRRVLPAARRAKKSGTAPFIAWLEAHARATPDALCWELDAQRLSFAEARSGARRAASVLVDAGIRPGDVVALIGGNSLGYLQLLLAIGYAGAVAALISPELGGEPLAHALRASEPRLSLVEQPNAQAIAALGTPALSGKILVYGAGELEQRISRAPEIEKPLADPAGDFVYIFTSGTTGLPKPCRVRHERARRAATTFGSVAFQYRTSDKLYCALPLHHASALLVGIGAALVAGVPVALRRKFSAREFAPDLVRYGATAALYVGDMCRALVHTQPSAAERACRLRVVVGNGLGADVW